MSENLSVKNKKFNIKEILDTLPIGYYLGHRFEVDIRDLRGNGKTLNHSYIDFESNTIIVSKSELIEQLKAVDETDYEKALRTAFYHLVSHIMLSPSILFGTKSFIHTFEDERVESLLSNYFLDVDFASSVKEQGKKQFATFDGIWYSIVRLRRGPAAFVEQVSKIIRKFPDIITNSERYYAYVREVEQLYSTVYGYWKDTYKPQMIQHEHKDNLNYTLELPEEAISEIEQTFNNKAGGENSATTQNKTGGMKLSHQQQDKDNNNTRPSKFNKKKISPKEQLNQQNIQALKRLIKNKCKAAGNDQTPIRDEGDTIRILNANQTLYDKLRFFIEKVLNKTGQSSAIASYSGQFDYRNCIRDDYRYFSVKNQRGSAKKFKEKRLNLFLDCSGSFSGSAEINGILKVLKKIETRYPDFDYTVTLVSMSEITMPKHNRWHYPGYAGCGTHLTPNIFNIFNKVQKRNCENYNIVMYDGDCKATIHHSKMGYENCFQAFNSKNTVLIIEQSNEQQVSKYCKKAKVIVAGKGTANPYSINSLEYVAEIEINIIKAFSYLFS